MKTWMHIILWLVVGYFLGVFFPSVGQSLKSKVGM